MDGDYNEIHNSKIQHVVAIVWERGKNIKW